jgi:signal transduction histidine kinase
VSLPSARADRVPAAEAAGPAGAVHQATLERAFGRIFGAVTLVIVLQFWVSAGPTRGQRPGSLAASLLLSGLLVGQALLAFRRPPSQRDVNLLAAATVVLVLAIRILAVPGSPFLEQDAYVMVVPTAAAWAVWSRRLVIPVPLLLMILGTGPWQAGSSLAVEQAVAALPTVIVGGVAARFMRAGARQADDAADRLSRQLAAQAAALAAEEAGRRAANSVHDDVLSVLRAVAVTDQPLPWSVLVAKARQAQAALARRVRRVRHGSVDLGSELRRQAQKVTPELVIRWRVGRDLEVPAAQAEALCGAAGEVLRNVVAHAGVRDAAVTVRGDGSGGVEVTISDDGAGFDPAQVGPLSRGLRHSILGRLRDAGGEADVLSSTGQGTTVVLTWRPAGQSGAVAVDSLEWARRLAPSPQLIFLGFMLPALLSGLLLLCLLWRDMRWQAAAAAVFASLVGLAVVCARCLSQVRMTRRVAVSLTAAVTALAAVGSLAVAPGTTDSFAFWVSGDTGIVIAAVYFICGPVPGLTALALDLAALTVGVLACGGAVSVGARASILGSPVIGAGLAVGFLAAFRGLSNYTESQLASYRERLSLRARAEAISHVDRAALDNARRVAGPVLRSVICSPGPDSNLQTMAGLANATLRDELLAPGFLTVSLADRVHAARVSGASITVDFAQQSDTALVQTARDLLAATLPDLEAGDEVTLQVHPSAEERPALLILHARIRSDHALLRWHAAECGALISDLDDHRFLLRLQSAPRRAAVPAP